MIRPIPAPARLALLEAEGPIGYRRGEKATELEKSDFPEFNARVTSRISAKGWSWSML
jgi:hypothetical protein